MVISQDSNRVLLTAGHATVLLNALNGEILWIRNGEIEIATSKSIFSPSGELLFLGSFPISEQQGNTRESYVTILRSTDSTTKEASITYQYTQSSQSMLLPFSASDNGTFLGTIDGTSFTERLLFNSSCNLIWSARSSRDERFISGAPYGGTGCLSRSGQRMCIFSNGQIQVFRIREK